MKLNIQYTGYEKSFTTIQSPIIPRVGEHMSIADPITGSYQTFKVINIDYGIKDGMLDDIDVFLLEE